MWHLEDDENDRFLFARVLSAVGPDVKLRTFGSVEAAIAALEAIQNPPEELPHLIVTDLMLPRLNGLEFIRWVRASQCRCLPLVMLSGSALPTDVLAAYEAGVSAFLTKPADLRELDEVLRQLLHFWGRTAQNPTDHIGEDLVHVRKV